jgi:hypothetical protein
MNAISPPMPPSLWAATAPPAPETAPLTGDARTGVAVVVYTSGPQAGLGPIRAEAQGHVGTAAVVQTSAALSLPPMVPSATVTDAELADSDLPLETLLWRLFNEDEVRVFPAQPLSKCCRCSVEHIRNVLGQFPEAERAEMRNADGVISVDCEFCSRQFLLEI